MHINISVNGRWGALRVGKLEHGALSRLSLEGSNFQEVLDFVLAAV